MGGRVVCTLPATLRVPTGAVTFTVRASGYESVTRTVSVEGQAPHREAGVSTRRAVSYGLIGVGAAAKGL